MFTAPRFANGLLPRLPRRRPGWASSRFGPGLALGVLATAAAGQSSAPAIFVANNGNLQGSVSSFLVDEDGTLQLVDLVITGERDTLSDPCPGCNAYTIDLSPNGRFVATGHAASDDATQQVTILEVLADATLSIAGVFTVPSSPLDVAWISDDLLAVTVTDFSAGSSVRVWSFDPETPSLTLADSAATGSFNSSLAVDRSRRRLFTQNSFGNTVSSWDVDLDGTLTFIQTIATGGVYPLGMGLAPNGERLYAGGGISSGGNAIVGMNVDPVGGGLSLMPGSSFNSPGASPKQVAVSADGQHALVAHGTDATVRVFDIDANTGTLTSAGVSFDVGLQGSLGLVSMLGDLVFFTDNTTAIDGVRGVYSFTLGADGSLTMNGGLLDTGGIGPQDVATWAPPSCPADVDGNGTVGFTDLLEVLGAWGSCPPGSCPADIDDNGAVDFTDLLQLLGAWGPCV